MKRIHKYAVPDGDTFVDAFTLQLPKGARILSVQVQDEQGPQMWALVDPEIVPPFILQVPVRYYRRPPAYFHGWAASAPPRWAEHWGPAWAEKHRGWDQGDREARSATIQGAGVERVILRGIREIRDGKIAALRCCLPERSDAQTARFLEWEEVHAPLDGGIAPPLVTLC